MHVAVRHSHFLFLSGQHLLVPCKGPWLMYSPGSSLAVSQEQSVAAVLSGRGKSRGNSQVEFCEETLLHMRLEYSLPT